MEGVVNPSNGGGGGGGEEEEMAAVVGVGGEKPKVVVIMGPTGSGKSRLAIDLASHFPVEIINADSMQVYQGLDVLTNKVPLHDQKGVPHHLLGTISPNTEFTSKDFRDAAIPIIDDIISRNLLPVIVGGTNFYIQALVSPFLSDDLTENVDSHLTDPSGDMLADYKTDFRGENLSCTYQTLEAIDPVAAKRIHPNDHRKISQYLNLYVRVGVMPSKLFQGKGAEGRTGVELMSFRYNCCFICVDASQSVLDHYVEQRVDCMLGSGLLSEVNDIYTAHADYTKGLRQAIGVREFKDYLRVYISEGGNGKDDSYLNLKAHSLTDEGMPKNCMCTISSSSCDGKKDVLAESIEKLKANTRRLVRRQKRRLNRLQMLFGWRIHLVDSTDSLIGSSGDSWANNVVNPSVEIIKSFLNESTNLAHDCENGITSTEQTIAHRDLWNQYFCEGCGKVLRGAHEWEQHKQGRHHRKRMSQLKKKAQRSHAVEQRQHHGA